MGGQSNDVAEAQRQALMGYFRLCQTIGATPDISVASTLSGLSAVYVESQLLVILKQMADRSIIGEGPEFKVLSEVEQERIWNERGGRKEK